MAKPKKPSTSADRTSGLSQNKTDDATETPEVGKDVPKTDDRSASGTPQSGDPSKGDTAAGRTDAIEDAVLIEDEDSVAGGDASLWPDAGDDTASKATETNNQLSSDLVADDTSSAGDDTITGDDTPDSDKSAIPEATGTDVPANAYKPTERDDVSSDSPADTSSAYSSSSIPKSGPAPREVPAIRKGPGFFTMLLGGIAAGAIGYYAAYYTEFAPFAGEDGTGDALAQQLEQQSALIADQAARLDEFEALVADAGNDGDMGETVGALEQQITELQAALAGLEPSGSGLSAEELEAFRSSSQGDVAGLQARLDELSQQSQSNIGDITSQFEGQLAEVTQSLASLTAQVSEQDLPSAEDLAALEQRISDLNDQVTPLDDRIAELNAQIAEQDEQIARAEAAAEAETRRVSAQAALSQIAAAVENGTPYQDALGALRGTTDTEVPAGLADPAPEGVATIAALQESYPNAARTGLDASIGATAGDGALNRFGAFIKSQTGARALNEREGDDPDAILSRAEARLRSGDLAAALSELRNLPPEGQDAMGDWMAQAEERLAARAALDEISTTLTSN